MGLRVGLTGGLGSGKSTVGHMLAELGAAVIDADEVGRTLMQPGEAVYQQIVEQFGPGIVRADGSLDRRALAEQAFQHGRLAELNRIVHPAVIAAQERWMLGIFASNPGAVAVIESALIFEASGQAQQDEAAHAAIGDQDQTPREDVKPAHSPATVPGWRERFDRIILVTAPEELKVRRYVERSVRAGVSVDPDALAADARKRLGAQIPDEKKLTLSDWVLENSGEIETLAAQVQSIYPQLARAAAEAQSR